MRIVAGKYKRTVLDSLEGVQTRPTKDMVKEALFDALQVRSDESFLDLFAGSGAIGIEALSRGCKPVIFNDIHRDAIKIIETNLSKIHEEARVLNLNYEECLQKLKNEHFDYVFLDPPYAFEHYDIIMSFISNNDMLNKRGIVVVEIKSDRSLKDTYLNLELYKEKKYGITKLMYYRKKENND